MSVPRHMAAIVFDGKRPHLRRVAVPHPRAGEALVAVSLAGVCSTDLEICKGYMGFRGVMGHEFVGTVVSGPAAWRGRRVVGEINCPCGRCPMCRRGLGNHCPRRTVIGIAGHDGAFAQYLSVPVANLHAVPRSVSDEAAVLVEPLAAALQILEQVPLRRSDRVVVLGDGRLGQLAARVIRLKVPQTQLVGKHAGKLNLARRQGIATCLLPEFRPGADADVAVDATGSPAGLELAVRCVRPRGVIVLKSTYAGAAPIVTAPLVINEVTVVGSRCGPFDKAIRCLARRQVEVADLVSSVFPLSRGLEALRAARQSGNCKVIIDVRTEAK